MPPFFSFFSGGAAQSTGFLLSWERDLGRSPIETMPALVTITGHWPCCSGPPTSRSPCFCFTHGPRTLSEFPLVRVTQHTPSSRIGTQDSLVLSLLPSSDSGQDTGTFHAAAPEVPVLGAWDRATERVPFRTRLGGTNPGRFCNLFLRTVCLALFVSAGGKSECTHLVPFISPLNAFPCLNKVPCFLSVAESFGPRSWTLLICNPVSP